MSVVSSVSLSQSFLFLEFQVKNVYQDKIFGIFYVQIHENLHICTDFSEISLSKNQQISGNLHPEIGNPSPKQQLVLPGIGGFGEDYLFWWTITLVSADLFNRNEAEICTYV